MESVVMAGRKISFHELFVSLTAERLPALERSDRRVIGFSPDFGFYL